MNPFTERHQLQLQPLPDAAEALLRQYRAPPRLIAHHLLVHDVASQLLDAFRSCGMADGIDATVLLFGAATHDIGKICHPRELSHPGHEHEHAGKLILLQAGTPPALSRFAETHGQQTMTASTTIEDLLVRLADTCWKGTRDTNLEQHVIDERSVRGNRDTWAMFLSIDDIVETLAAEADRRLSWQSLFAVDG